MSTHTPAILVAKGFAHFQKNCIFTDRYPSFPADPFETMIHPLLPLSLKLPSPNPRIAFYVVEQSRLSINIFFRPCALFISPVVCFLVLFSVKVLDETVDTRPTLSEGSVGFLQLSLCSLSPKNSSLIHLHGSLLYSGSYTLGVNSGIIGSQIFGCFFLLHSSLCLVFGFSVFAECIHEAQNESDELVISPLVYFFFFLLCPAHLEAILSHTCPRLCHHHLFFHLVRFSASSFSSFLFVESARISYFSINCLQRVNHSILFFHRNSIP